VQAIIDRTTRSANYDKRPAWDSSWQTGAEENMEQASGCLSDFAGVGVCGVKPFNSKNKYSDTPAMFSSCGGRIHDMAANIQPIAEPEESKSVLRRLLEAQVGRADPIGTCALELYRNIVSSLSNVDMTSSNSRVLVSVGR
jgi:hypothetical protein